MYRTMIIKTITSREDRATITAIIGVSSETKRKEQVIIVSCNEGLKLEAQEDKPMRGWGHTTH